MGVPKTQAEQKAAIDHAYGMIEEALDAIRKECDYGWLRAKLWGGYRITADSPTGPDRAWTFDCALCIDGQETDLALEVPCMGKVRLLAGGEPVPFEQELGFPAIRERMKR